MSANPRQSDLLLGLTAPVDGTAKRISSADRKGGNVDFITLGPKTEVTLLDEPGPGIIHTFWFTISPINEATLRQVILRMYWDDSPFPSVEAPLGDFFGTGFGKESDYISMPITVWGGGFSCFWKMPFRRHARWTLTNMAASPVEAFYYNVDLRRQSADGLSYFHAQWRRENPTRGANSYTFLDVLGKGHIVGAAIFMQSRHLRGLEFLEGDDVIYIDGAPSIQGTGAEDYFLSAWFFDRGPFWAPFHGHTVKDEELGTISAYRWHVPDPIPFQESAKMTLEHGSGNTAEGDYSSIAFYYLQRPTAAASTIPADARHLLPFHPRLSATKTPGAIEAESLLVTASSPIGTIWVKSIGPFENSKWSDGRTLAWNPTVAGAVMTLSLPAPASGTYRMTLYFGKANYSGKVRLAVGDKPIGDELDLFTTSPVPMRSDPIQIEPVVLTSGPNRMTVTTTGRDPRASNYGVDIDAIVLTRIK